MDFKRKSNGSPHSAEVDSKTNLLIVTDLGHFKAYRLEQDVGSHQRRLETIDATQTEVTNHLSETLTVQAGRLRKAGSQTGAGSDGQDHNLSLERRHRAVRALGKRIQDLVSREKPERFYFAADPQINEPLLAELDQRTRDKISRNICANLSKLTPGELLKRFEPKTAKP